MYYAIGVSAPSLHRESTNSLIHVHVHVHVRKYETVTEMHVRVVGG